MLSAQQCKLYAAFQTPMHPCWLECSPMSFFPCSYIFLCRSSSQELRSACLFRLFVLSSRIVLLERKVWSPEAKYIDEIPCKKKSNVVNNIHKISFQTSSNQMFIFRVNLYLQLPIKISRRGRINSFMFYSAK